MSRSLYFMTVSDAGHDEIATQPLLRPGAVLENVPRPDRDPTPLTVRAHFQYLLQAGKTHAFKK